MLQMRLNPYILRTLWKNTYPRTSTWATSQRLPQRRYRMHGTREKRQKTSCVLNESKLINPQSTVFWTCSKWRWVHYHGQYGFGLTPAQDVARKVLSKKALAYYSSAADDELSVSTSSANHQHAITHQTREQPTTKTRVLSPDSSSSLGSCDLCRVQIHQRPYSDSNLPSPSL